MGEFQDRLEAEIKRTRELTMRSDIFEEVARWFDEAKQDWENTKNKKVWYERWLTMKEIKEEVAGIIEDKPLEDTV